MAMVSKALHQALKPAMQRMWTCHRERTRALTRVAHTLGCAGSWNGLLKPVRSDARSKAQRACERCGEKRLRANQMYRLFEATSGRQPLLCASCVRLASGLDRVRRSQVLARTDALNVRTRNVEGLGAFPERDQYVLGESSEDMPFVTREEVDGELDDPSVGRALRDNLAASGYGFVTGGGDDPATLRPGGVATDATCAALADMLVSGLGHRCVYIDLSHSRVGDAGLASLGRALSSVAAPCQNLSFLNLNGNPAGDAGVEALAEGLTPVGRPAAARGGCPQLRVLYLVLDNLADRGALALAAALERGAAKRLKHLWCCGAFSAASAPGAATPGFCALTRACDDRAAGRGWKRIVHRLVVDEARALVLELEHGLPWGV